MYKIKELADLCKTSVKTLRFYDTLGILKPDYVDKFTDYRYYTPQKVDEYNRINALKGMGFSLSEISAMKAERNKHDFFGIKLKEAEEELKLNEAKLRKLRETAAFLENEEHEINLNVIETDDVSPYQLAYIRVLTNDRNELNLHYSRLLDILNKNKIRHGKEKIITNFDFELSEQMDLAVGVRIDYILVPELSELEDVKVKTLAEDIAAEIKFIANVADINKAYQSLYKYMTYYDVYTQVGPAFEVYLDSETIEVRIPVGRIERTMETIDEEELKKVPINDGAELGRWKIVSCVPDRDMFNTEKPKFMYDWTTFGELYLLPDFGKYWVVSWIKGYIKIHGAAGKPMYWNYYSAKTKVMDIKNGV